MQRVRVACSEVMRLHLNRNRRDALPFLTSFPLPAHHQAMQVDSTPLSSTASRPPPPKGILKNPLPPLKVNQRHLTLD